jgi:DHA2 family multidrug resistance protein-like MFS transporter
VARTGRLQCFGRRAAAIVRLMSASPSAQLPSPPSLHGNGRALAAVLMAVSLVTLDASITNTALPSIAASLHAEPAISI